MSVEKYLPANQNHLGGISDSAAKLLVTDWLPAKIADLANCHPTVGLPQHRLLWMAKDNHRRMKATSDPNLCRLHDYIESHPGCFYHTAVPGGLARVVKVLGVEHCPWGRSLAHKPWVTWTPAWHGWTCRSILNASYKLDLTHGRYSARSPRKISRLSTLTWAIVGNYRERLLKREARHLSLRPHSQAQQAPSISGSNRNLEHQVNEVIVIIPNQMRTLPRDPTRLMSCMCSQCPGRALMLSNTLYNTTISPNFHHYYHAY